MAEVLEYDETTGLSKLQAKNRFSTGDRLEVINQHGNRDIVMGQMKTEKGEVIESAKGSAYVVWADIGKTDTMTMLARYLTNDENVD